MLDGEGGYGGIFRKNQVIDALGPDYGGVVLLG